MTKIIHIWFNAEGVVIPPDNGWEKFSEVDALRTFLICAESWSRAGWTVRRHSTLGNFRKTPFLPDGRAAKHFHWYPADRWQYIAACRAVAEPGLNWFCSMDVINFGYTPPVDYPYVEGCMYFQPEHFSLSSFACAPVWLAQAEEILLNYDAGKLPEIRGEYVSDERILREYLGGSCCEGLQKFACAPGSEPLVHFARSTLGRVYQPLPLSYADQKQD